MKKIIILSIFLLVCFGWYYLESSKYDNILNEAIQYKKDYNELKDCERIPYGRYNVAVINDSTFMLGNIADYTIILAESGYNDNLWVLKHKKQNIYYSLFISNVVDTMEYIR